MPWPDNIITLASEFLSISFISGFVLAFPILTYQLWKFISPGLKVNETVAAALLAVPSKDSNVNESSVVSDPSWVYVVTPSTVESDPLVGWVSTAKSKSDPSASLPEKSTTVLDASSILRVKSVAVGISFTGLTVIVPVKLSIVNSPSKTE